ncbi:Fe-S oxidoreductase [Peptoclostridium litorale DSM 5388]|uniref:4Fe-4S domain binding protein n=1 Tax=Peptoclostridium litorale DSM 5388 TaxID=1121324 RepID=A0A069R9P7_PEPLI|nr:(Fe-S)-binding protein [Peptoclostridium litorale]KDR93756.1 4Fe-4S domain binding protein [Peptoclostridium litorale DSM 5388]SIN85242.1 Fe-S oxidoreductase [Peptoclostridium litorale DSM 5388]
MDFFNSTKEIIQKACRSADECIDCKLCMKNCPMLDEFCSSPKELWSKMARDEKLPISLPYSCVLCTYCSSVCPKGLDFKDIFFHMRKEILPCESTRSKTLSKGLRAVANHQKLSFSKPFTSVNGASGSKNFKVGFMPGCSLVSYRPDIIPLIYNYMHSNFEDCGILLHCCGKPTSSVGDEYSFKQYYGMLEDSIKACGCTTVITTCPNCYNTVSKNSPGIDVISLWEFMAEKGIPDGAACADLFSDLKFSLHDPCPTRSLESVHDSVRKLCSELGINTVEFESNRSKTPCCGQGGMVGLTNPPIAVRQMKKRAMQSDADCILTYCQACAESMQIGGAKTLHLLDILFPPSEKAFELDQKRPGLLGKWINRYKGKLLVDRI